MNKFSKENLIDNSSSKKTEKKQLFFLNKNNNTSILSKQNYLYYYESNNNLKHLSDNPSIESMENYSNYVGSKDIFDIKNISERNNNLNNNINFLRKKTKINFIITKQTEKKPKFFTTNYTKKIDDFLNKKGHRKSLKKIYQRRNLFQVSKCFYLDNSFKNINTNEGRWSYEEHIKFIESFVTYGKKWEAIQKYIGTRSSRQIRSHAQKFFLRLKELKTDKYSFNLRESNIQSLLDVINLIARSNESNKNNKEYIIDTLIALTELNLESNGKKFFEGKKDNLVVEINKEESTNYKMSKIDDESLNKININYKELKFNDLASDIDIIEDEDENIILNKKTDLEEKNINYNILLDLKEKNTNNNNDKVYHEEYHNSNYKFIENQINPNFIFNNNSFLLSDDSNFDNIDSASIESMNNIVTKNIKSKLIKFMI